VTKKIIKKIHKIEKKVAEKKTALKEKEVTYLKEPVVSFVSLVSHPANGKPFMLMKDAKGIRKVVQRVIVANDIPEDDKLVILKGLNVENQKKYETFTAYDQIEKSECKEDSFSGIDLDGSGKVVALLADLKKDVEEKGDSVEKAVKWNSWEVKDRIWDEMYALEKILMGVITQSNAEESWIKETITSASNNFMSFVQALTTDENIVKSVEETLDKLHEMRKSIEEKPVPDNETAPAELTKAVSLLSQIMVKLEKEDKLMEGLFKTKEDVAAFIKEVITERENEKEKSAEEKAKVEAIEKAAKDKDELITDLKKSVDTLKEEIEALKGTVPESGAGGDVDGLEKSNIKKSVWSGVLTTVKKEA